MTVPSEAAKTRAMSFVFKRDFPIGATLDSHRACIIHTVMLRVWVSKEPRALESRFHLERCRSFKTRSNSLEPRHEAGQPPRHKANHPQ